MSRMELLKNFASKYVWWKTPDEAILFPHRIIAQVMNMGDYSDVQLLTENISSEDLEKVLSNAEAGQFTPRSWHYRLGLSQLNEVPPLPIRKFA